MADEVNNGNQPNGDIGLPQSLSELAWPDQSKEPEVVESDESSQDQLDVRGGSDSGVTNSNPSPGSLPTTSSEVENSNIFVEKFRQRYGDSVDFASDDELFESLEQSFETFNSAPSRDEIDRIQKLQPQVNEYVQNSEEFHKYLTEKQERENSQKSQQVEPNLWAAPQVSDRTKQFMQSGILDIDQRTGLYKSDDPRLTSYAKEANDLVEWRKQASERLLTTNPWELAKTAGAQSDLDQMRESLREEIKKEIFSEFDQREQSKRQAEEEKEDLKKFCELDSAGNAKVANGQYILNERGQAFSEGFRKAEHYGIPGQNRINYARDYAMSIHPDSVAGGSEKTDPAGSQSAEPEIPPPTPKESRKQKQDEFIDRARTNGKHTVNRIQNSSATIANAIDTGDPQTEADELKSAWHAAGEIAREKLT